MTVDNAPGQRGKPPARATPAGVAALDRDRGPAFVTLPIAAIRAYEGNPRHAENAEYARIKASIRATGTDQPLIVTQRPGEQSYTIHSGGNTRLRILKELYDETGDARFAETTCVVRPWTQEVDVLLAHLRENDLRGPLTFLDKALAVCAAKRLFEEAQGQRRIKQIRLIEMLRAQGYALSTALVCQMTYTVERLLPVIPQALNAGMGRPQVERIRQLERAARALWLAWLTEDETAFEAVFTTLCRRYDGPDWNISDLRRALEAEIAERADASIHAINLGLEQALLGRHAAAPRPPGPAARETRADALASTPMAGQRDDARDEREATFATEGNAATDRATPSEQTFGVADRQSALDGPDSRQGHTGTPPEATRPADEAAGEPSVDESVDDAQAERPGDLKSLRARAWTLATRLAQRNGLGELIKPLSGQGLGFLLTDVPDPALVDQLDEDTLAQVSMVWWHLAAAAEMTVAPLEHLLSGLPEASVLRQALQAQDAGLLFSSVWTLDPGHMGFRLWRRLGERDWQDLMALMANYRALYRAVEASGDPLWR